MSLIVKSGQDAFPEYQGGGGIIQHTSYNVAAPYSTEYLGSVCVAKSIFRGKDLKRILSSGCTFLT